MTIDEAEKIKQIVENKDYISQLVNTVAKTMVEAFENLKIEDVNMFQLGYNKALDNVESEFLKCDKVHYNLQDILNVLNKVKAGETNENTRLLRNKEM